MAKVALPVARQAQAFQISPEFIRISTAAAITLGLVPGRMYREATCDCINLLLNYPEGCYANCTYCGLARERPGVAAENTFIRVGWPVFPTDLIAERIAECQDRVGRVCIAMVQDKRAYQDTLEVTRRVLRRSDVLISGLVMATVLDEERLAAFKAAGIDIIGVGLDAASEALFYRTRGRGARGPHSWTQHWEIVRIARWLFGPWKVNCHVIVGLGETDRDLVNLFYATRAEQIEAYLFSFNPEPGTAMADQPRAPLWRLRRIQLVKHLIEEAGLPRQAIEFNGDGGIALLQAPRGVVEGLIESGKPFLTDGCPDRSGKLACNRPYGSYRPGEPFRDYPFLPLADDRLVIRRELQLDEILV